MKRKDKKERSKQTNKNKDTKTAEYNGKRRLKSKDSTKLLSKVNKNIPQKNKETKSKNNNNKKKTKNEKIRKNGKSCWNKT